MGLMRWPFVSRERLEDAQRQIAELKQERKELLEMLLAKPKPVEEPKVVPVAIAESDEKKSGNNLLDFGTPFDRVENRFRRETMGIGKTPPSKYKVGIR